MKSKRLLLPTLGRLAVAAALVSLATLPLAAQGDRDQLKGTYFSTGSQSCLVSPFGFKPNLTPVDGGVFVQSSSVQGTVIFHADGTGTAEFKELLITHSPAPNAGATSTEQSFPFTYAVADDGALTLVTGPLSGTILTGSLKGVKFILTDAPLLSGRIERNGTAISLSTADPSVETLTLELPQPLALPRICHRMRVLIPVHSDQPD